MTGVSQDAQTLANEVLDSAKTLANGVFDLGEEAAKTALATVAEVNRLIGEVIATLTSKVTG